jgi:DNA-binding NarL/FixJ family response regulator
MIVESNETYREGLAMLITHTFGLHVVNTYSHCTDLIHALATEKPDVVLLATESLSKQAIKFACVKYIDRIKQASPYTKVIIFSSTDCQEFILDNLKAGADGYLTRDTPPSQLLEAIQVVHEGGAPLSPAVARAVITSFHRNTSSVLTVRETQVLELLAKGKTYSAIADALFIDKETVRTHIKNIYWKLEVHSKSEAIEKALSEKII